MSVEQNSLKIDVDNRVVNVADRGRSAARIPDTPERLRLERQRGIREIVFGAQDGVLTALGIVSGVGAATAERGAILITAGLSLLVGALSMGAGEFLGGRAERDVVNNAVEYERMEMATMPQAEYEEQIAYQRLKGFTDEEAEIIVRRLQKNPDIWLHEMVRDEFGIDLREAEGGGLRGTAAIAGSFALGAAVPILPYALGMPLRGAPLVALLLAACVLFGIGYYSGKLGGRRPVLKGLEIVLVGAAIFALSYSAGRYVPPLFGHASIGVGG